MRPPTFSTAHSTRRRIARLSMCGRRLPKWSHSLTLSPRHARRTIAASGRCLVVMAQVSVHAASRLLLVYLHLRYGQCAVDFVGGKLDLVAFLESIEHRRIFHSKHHGHAGHFEIRNRIVLER